MGVLLRQSQPDFTNNTGRGGRWVGGEEARGHQVLSKLSSSDLVINNSLKERMEEEKQTTLGGR